MTRQELIALWEYALYLEQTEKGSELYNQIKAALIEQIKQNPSPTLISSFF